MDITARITRGSKYWIVEVPEVPAYTQARTITEARDMAIDVAAVALGVAPETINLVKIESEDFHSEYVEAVREATRKAQEAEAARLRVLQDAVHQLRNDGLVQREVATLLDISPQRVHQLEHQGELADA